MIGAQAYSYRLRAVKYRKQTALHPRAQLTQTVSIVVCSHEQLKILRARGKHCDCLGASFDRIRDDFSTLVSAHEVSKIRLREAPGKHTNVEVSKVQRALGEDLGISNVYWGFVESWHRDTIHSWTHRGCTVASVYLVLGYRSHESASLSMDLISARCLSISILRDGDILDI